MSVNAFVDYYGVAKNKIEATIRPLADISQKRFEKSVSINPENPMYYYALAALHVYVLFGWNTEKML